MLTPEHKQAQNDLNKLRRYQLDKVKMAPPKDYADKSELLYSKPQDLDNWNTDDWECKNKESYSQIARYLLFIFGAAVFGLVLIAGVLS